MNFTRSFFLALFWLIGNANSFTTFAQAPEYTLKEFNNIQYYASPSPDSSLTQLNVIIPEGAEKPPVFIWIGQGAWAYVNKDVEMKISRQFAKQGIAVISAQHRLSPALLGEKKRFQKTR